MVIIIIPGWTSTSIQNKY